MPDDLIHNLDELFAATGVDTLYDMSDHLYAVLELDLDATCHMEDETTLAVIIGRIGTAFEFPFSLDEFYGVLEELNEEAEAMSGDEGDDDGEDDEGLDEAGEQEDRRGPE